MQNLQPNGLRLTVGRDLGSLSKRDTAWCFVNYCAQIIRLPL